MKKLSNCIEMDNDDSEQLIPVTNLVLAHVG